jgi:antitoxin (DNA-binding transcriptional repressor) of toxin-antitoxin stability system
VTGSAIVIDLLRVEWFIGLVTTTWEQMQSELPRLLDLVEQGEEVVITKQGRVIAKLTGVAQARPARDRKGWLAKLARLRGSAATGKAGASTEEILEDLRSERG